MKKPKASDDQKTSKPKDAPKGYPLYPKKDDIYSRSKEEKQVDPDNLARMKNKDSQFELDPEEELEIDGNIPEDELDVPGSDLDDDQEDIGNEDEENNYYSIGGDNHENLDEDNQTYDLDEDDES
jgi:hypothetical protein